MSVGGKYTDDETFVGFLAKNQHLAIDRPSSSMQEWDRQGVMSIPMLGEGLRCDDDEGEWA